MAAPVYTTDLADLNTAESTTNWSEPGTDTAGGLPVAETDYFIEGTGCISKTFNATGIGGLLYNSSSGKTIPSPGAFYCWCYFACPNALDTEANGGMRLIIGSATTAFKGWYLKGSDSYTYGGWVCLVVDPTLAADQTVGSPSATLQYFGYTCKLINAVSKGNPLGCDVIRYGRGTLQSVSGEAANYATFLGAASYQDASTRRWGILQAIDGGYLFQGHFLMGTAGTAVDFRDSNRNISIANTKKVVSSFNAFEIRNSSSRVDWTNINIAALGTVSRGNFITTDNADVNFDTCVFTDMGTFGFLSNGTILNSTFRRTDLITQGGAVFDNCVIDSNRGAVNMLVSNLDNIDNCTFISDGTGHAIELTAAHAGGSYTLAGTAFTGYAVSDGSTGNEAIYNNSGGAVTINITAGGTTPSIRNGAGASTTVVAGSVTVEITVKNSSAVAIQDARVLLIAEAGGPFPSNVTVTISNSGTTATVTHTGHGLATNDKVQIKGASLTANNGVFTITKINNDSYSYTMGSTPGSSPTGTIKAWFVPLYGTTDVNGYISSSRVYASSQPISGRVRKSTSGALYKTSTLTGTVSNSTGLSATIQLILDQ